MPSMLLYAMYEGIEFPSIPGFNINEANDISLKKHFDHYRERKEPHPF